MKNYSSGGFTLVEMMVVLLVITSMMMIATPFYHQSLGNRQAEVFMEELEQNIQYYQLYAMVHQVNVGIHPFNSPGPGYHVRVNGLIVETVRAPPEIAGIRNLNSGHFFLNFSSRGGLNNHMTMEISRTDSDKTYRVIFQIIRGRFHINEIG